MWPFTDDLDKELRAIGKRFKCPTYTQELPPDTSYAMWGDAQALLKWITKNVPEGCGQFSFGASCHKGMWLMWTEECEAPEIKLTALHELGHYVCQWKVLGKDRMQELYFDNPVPYEVEAWKWTQSLLPEYGIGKNQFLQIRDFSISTYEEEMKLRKG